MAREGTRSATGNSKPRVFQTVDTAPAIKRMTKPKTATKKETSTVNSLASKIKGAKPAGVTKKKGPAKKEEGVGAKVKAAVTKAAAKVKGADAKPKKATKAKTAAK